MCSLIRVLFLIVFVSALSGKILSSPVDEDGFEVGPDIVEYETSEDEFELPQRPWKRGSFGFWSPHPSDYNPMRRPGSTNQAPRSNKRSDAETPYHPVPRTIVTGQKRPRPTGAVDLDEFLESYRDKRQSPGSFLLMKLGRMNKAQERKLGRRSTLPYQLATGNVQVKQNQG